MAKRKRTGSSTGKEDRYSLIPQGKDYKPFIVIQDVPSLGRSSRIHGIKTQRQHDFLSDLERDYFLILEFSDDVIDIREQFPLELRETLLIAVELGIKHPANPVSKKHMTMTSDFCITIRNGNSTRDIIRTMKYKKDLLNRRNIEKFTIERTYWKRYGLDWGIVTEEEINKSYCQNISDILDYYDLSNNDAFQDISEGEREDLIVAFMQRLMDSGKTVRQISSLFEKDTHLQKGAGIVLFKYLLARKYISTDLFSPLCLDKHVEVNLCNKAKAIGEVAS